MNEAPDSLDLRSADISEDKRRELLRLFPEVATEGGKLDFERLKLILGEAVEVGRERYGMNWPGKADCIRAIQTPSLGALRPVREESLAFDTTENLIIEGDNLEVLKLLQKSYLGKVKLIYIDPPYNTGSDFIYPDKYSESLETYLQYTGQVDADGRKFGTNTEADGRFHSRWMSMMYPRLYLAHNLLQDDGIMFISIDDGELKNLLHICDEIFGPENSLATIVLKNKAGAGAKPKGFIPVHEYVVCYARRRETIFGISLPMSAAQKALYNKRDEHFETRGPYGTWALATTSMGERRSLRFAIRYKGEDIWPEKQWLWSKERVAEAMAKNEVVFNQKPDGTWSVRFKRYLRDDTGETNEATPTSVWDGPYTWNGPYTHEGTRDIDALFGTRVFSFPKPVALLRRILDLTIHSESDTEGGIVLDFFAGSGTTAHAVLQANAEGAARRRFILVQLPEPLSPEIEEQAAGAKFCLEHSLPLSIAELTKERVRRAIRALDDARAGKLEFENDVNLDRGFRVFKLAESNFTTWDAARARDPEDLAEQLEMHVEHIRAGRSADDLLHEILLKSGFPLTTPVETLDLAGKRLHSVAGGALLVCLESELSLEFIRAVAERKPERVVILDKGFAGNDQLKANAVQIFRTNGITSFRTV